MKGCIRGHRGSVLEAARLLSAGIHHQNIALNDDVDSSDRFVISAKNLINKVLARGGEMICPRRWHICFCHQSGCHGSKNRGGSTSVRSLMASSG